MVFNKYKYYDLSGSKFGKWSVLSRSGSDKFGNATWLCRCECGTERKVPTGQLRKRNSQSCGCSRKGANHSRWKGGRSIDKQGYVHIAPAQSFGDLNFRSGELEHIIVMCRSLKRRLYSNESVHHKNGIRSDNRLENLELWDRSQPYGQRVDDKVQWAVELLKKYRPDLLK